MCKKRPVHIVNLLFIPPCPTTVLSVDVQAFHLSAKTIKSCEHQYLNGTESIASDLSLLLSCTCIFLLTSPNTNLR